MLLIHAPLTKPCEPPAALAYLSASLQLAGIGVTVCDLNIEAVRHLLGVPIDANDTWSRRAAKNVDRNLAHLEKPDIYHSNAKYQRAVRDVNRVLEQHGRSHNLQLSLSNYTDNTLSPLSSGDLLRAAENFSENIFFPFCQNRLDELIQSHRPNHIGFSLSFLSQALTTFALIGYLKTAYPELQIIVGGGLITTWFGGKICRESGEVVDHPFSELVEHLIPGHGELFLPRIFGKPAAPLVTPDFSTLRDNKYIAPGFILPYATSFGCYWRKCSFCPETSERNQYHQIPPSQVAGELRELAVQYRPSMIHLLDNGIPPATLKAIIDNPPGAPWYGFVRFEKLLADREFCSKLRKSGCTMLKLGLESGDQSVLDALHKGIDIADARKILKNLKGAGIATYVYLLFGTPAETRISAGQTLQFVKNNCEDISFLNLAIFNLPVASAEAAELDTGSFYTGDLQIYKEFVHPHGWNRGEIRRFLDSEFRKEPAIAQVIQNDPPFFTSNHASLCS